MGLGHEAHGGMLAWGPWAHGAHGAHAPHGPFEPKPSAAGHPRGRTGAGGRWAELRNMNRNNNIGQWNTQKTSNRNSKLRLVCDPGTGPIGFVSKFHAISWYLCVQNSHLYPDRTKQLQYCLA